jgi:Glycosyl transferase family 90
MNQSPFMLGNIRRMKWAIFPALTIAALFYYFSNPLPPNTYSYPSGKHSEHVTQGPTPPPVLRPSLHPITTLIENAEDTFTNLLSKETHDLASAAQAYRSARGRHPPPGFDVWFDVAKHHDVIMVEEFWDQIYHDLRPFWALPPNQIRADARSNDMVVNIKGGEAKANTGWQWHVTWAEMIGTVSKYLPDMVIPCNAMDEPRLLVPWDTINTYVETEQNGRRMTATSEISDVYHNWRKDEEDNSVEATKVEWKDSSSISLIREACPPDSKLRRAHEVSEEFRNGSTPEHMSNGFVANYTLSTNLCHQPDLGIYHGAINQPLTSSWSQKLTPLFGGSKLAVNNEILLPAAKPWTEDERFSAGEGADTEWSSKESQTMWRGTATGGRHHPTNWHQFHRHRFVYLANGTKLQTRDKVHDNILTPNFMHTASSSLSRSTRDHLPEYVADANDVGFTDLFCDETGENGSCWYLDNEYSVLPGIPMSQHFNYKYLPDIDGNSFSGRYRAFLVSTSLPIKATIYREWHDSRLVPWKHFIPMDNRFTDYYGILEYFRGFEGHNGSEEVPGHDEAARKIAYDGRDWANKALRKEDMQIYVFRLLLEYARTCDDNRDNLAFVGDLKDGR